MTLCTTRYKQPQITQPCGPQTVHASDQSKAKQCDKVLLARLQDPAERLREASIGVIKISKQQGALQKKWVCKLDMPNNRCCVH